MLVNLSELRPNPVRDFTIDPIDEEAVKKLHQSIADDGFWGGVVCRRNNGHLEIAAGHHRVQAAIAAGIAKAEVFVGDYSDEKMIRVYARENATQRGNTGTAITGTIAATIKYLTKERLGQKLDSHDFVRVSKKPQYEIGEPSITKFLKDVPGITRHSVLEQLDLLKSSGEYARIINEVYHELETENKLEEAKKAAEVSRKANEKHKRTFDREGVAKIFSKPSHMTAFKKTVDTPIGHQYLATDKQAELAKEIAELAKKRNSELTADFIKENTASAFFDVKQEQRKLNIADAELERFSWEEKERELQNKIDKSVSALVKLIAERNDHLAQTPEGVTVLVTVELHRAYANLIWSVAELKKGLP